MNDNTLYDGGKQQTPLLQISVLESKLVLYYRFYKQIDGWDFLRLSEGFLEASALGCQVVCALGYRLHWDRAQLVQVQQLTDLTINFR